MNYVKRSETWFRVWVVLFAGKLNGNFIQITN